MTKKKYIFSLIILLLLSCKTLSEEKVRIVYKIDSEIITNVDIDKEFQYLMALNAQLKNLSKKKTLEVSKESALREKIKKIELSKYFDLEEIDINIDSYLINFYKSLGLESKAEFKKYIEKNNLTSAYIEKKIQLEVLWNQLIYKKYKNQINIDEKKLKKKLKKINSKRKDNKIYFLSEILFEKEKNINLETKMVNIDESISEIGFENTATIYSISSSSKFGGKIGKIEERQLSKKIIQKLESLKIGEYTTPIQTGSSFLILKIDEIKYEKKIVNEKVELEKMIQFETSRQLDQFSKIFYNKVKINRNIDEL